MGNTNKIYKFIILNIKKKFTEGGNGNPFQYSCWENFPWTEKPDGLQSIGSQSHRTTEQLSRHARLTDRV